jgi:hypothetical protein
MQYSGAGPAPWWRPVKPAITAAGSAPPTKDGTNHTRVTRRQLYFDGMTGFIVLVPYMQPHAFGDAPLPVDRCRL